MSNLEQQTLVASITSFNELRGQLSPIAEEFSKTLNLILSKRIGDPSIPNLYAQLKQIYAQEEQIVNKMDKEIIAMRKIPNEKITASHQKSRDGFIRLMKEEFECLGEHYALMEDNKK